MGFGIGSKKVKSSSKQTNTVQNSGFSEIAGTAIAANAGDDLKIYDSRSAVEGDHSNVMRGDNNSIQYLDGGAIAAAFDFAETANMDAADSIQESISAVVESARSETENVAYQIKTVGVYVVVGFFGWQIVKAWSK